MTSVDIWGPLKRHFGVWGSYYILSLIYIIFRLPEGVSFFQGTTASYYNYHSWSQILSLDINTGPLIDVLTDTIPVGQKLFYSWGPLPGWYFLLWGDWIYLGLSFVLAGVLGSLHLLSHYFTKSHFLSFFCTLLFVFSAPVNEIFLSDFDTIPVNSLFTLLLSALYFRSAVQSKGSLRTLQIISTLAILHRIDLFVCFLLVTFFIWVKQEANRKLKEPFLWLGLQVSLLFVFNYLKFGSFTNMGAGINKVHNDFYSYLIYFDYSFRDLLIIDWSQLFLSAIQGETFWGNQAIIYIEFRGFLLLISLLLGLFFHRILKEKKLFEGVFLFPFVLILYLLTIRILETRYLLFLVPVSLVFISVLLSHFSQKKIITFLLISFSLLQGYFFFIKLGPLPYLFAENKKDLSRVFQDDWAQIPLFLSNDRYNCRDIMGLSDKDLNFFFPGILRECQVSTYFGFWQKELAGKRCQFILRFQDKFDCSSKYLRSDEGDLRLENLDEDTCLTTAQVSSNDKQFYLLLLEPKKSLISSEYRSGHQLVSIEKQCSLPL